MFLTERTSRDLGWDELKSRLSSFCQSAPGRDDALNLSFFESRADLEEELRAVTEACDILSRREKPPLSDVLDVSPYLARATKGGTLSTQALLEIARLAQASNLIKGFLWRRRDHYPAITARYGRLERVEGLGEEIRSVLHDSGEVRDSASPMLSELRAQMLRLREGIIARFKEICATPIVKDMLQDEYYTLRSGRYVIPVKASFKNQMKGIIHGASQTGETLFIEPDAFIEPGNDIKICESKIDDEIERLLHHLTASAAGAASILSLNLDTLRRLDVLFAKAELASTLNSGAPSFGSRLNLKSARHPLLCLRGCEVVPNDISMPGDACGMLISGPNAGGKTVVLKTAGISAIMARAGIPPAVSPGSTIPIFDVVFSVFGDAQDLGGDLSSFSGHVMQINSIIDRAGPESLVLLDEIASDTDPREGAALAASIIENLVARKCTVLATSHFHELREWASSLDGVVNASVGYDLLRLRPSFKLEVGVSGESFALKIASSLGMNAGIIERAKSFLGRTYVEGEKLLAALKGREDELERSLARARELESRLTTEFEEKARAMEAAMRADREAFEKEREKFLSGMGSLRERAAAEVAKLMKAPSMKDAVETERWISEVLRDMGKSRAAAGAPPSRPPSPGDTVEVKGMGIKGILDRIDFPKREATVSSSGKRLLVPLSRIQLAEPEIAAGGDPKRAARTLLDAIESGRKDKTAAVELDLRGMFSDEAVTEVEGFLDRSFRDGTDQVRIIHGHGTGALKNAVRDYLRRCPYTSSFRSGEQSEGGDGVTVVMIKKS